VHLVGLSWPTSRSTQSLDVYGCSIILQDGTRREMERSKQVQAFDGFFRKTTVKAKLQHAI
jgi:hypothetical protein